MQIGTSLYTYLWQYPLYSAIERVASMGFTLLELPATPPFMWPDHFSAFERLVLKRRLHDAGISIYSVNPTFLDLNPVSPNPDIQKSSVREIEANLRLAADIGASVVIATPGKRHPLAPARFEDTEELALEIFGRLARIAGELGVVIALENLASNFLSTGSQLTDFANKVGSPWCGVLYDLANARSLETGDPIDPLYTVSPQLKLVHFADAAQGNWGHLALGAGDIDFARARDVLQDIGYNGPVLLETIYPADSDGSLRHSIAELNRIGLEIG